MARQELDFSAECFKGGTLDKICALARRQCNISLSVVFPKSDGWGQEGIGGSGGSSGFCQIIKNSKDGAKHCRACHVLMTVAACSQGMTEQTCHAGATVLVLPIDPSGDGGMALLSSCAFRNDDKKQTWATVTQRAKALGLDTAEVRKEFDRLPDLNEARAHCLKEIMPVAIEAIKDIRQRMSLQHELDSLRHSKDKSSAGALLKEEFRESAMSGSTAESLTREGIGGLKGKKTPALVQVVCSLVSRRPQVPYTVEELAAAARMTPNYFSSIFHKHTGQCFMDYLTDRRIERSQSLLCDPSLNIAEIASMSGYDDPGYFTRRFKKKTGVTPREWRERGGKG